MAYVLSRRQPGSHPGSLVVHGSWMAMCGSGKVVNMRMSFIVLPNQDLLGVTNAERIEHHWSPLSATGPGARERAAYGRLGPSTPAGQPRRRHRASFVRIWSWLVGILGRAHHSEALAILPRARIRSSQSLAVSTHCIAEGNRLAGMSNFASSPEV